MDGEKARWKLNLDAVKDNLILHTRAPNRKTSAPPKVGKWKEQQANMPTYHMKRGTLGYMNSRIPYVVVSSVVNLSYTRPLPVQYPMLQLIQPHNPAQLLELNQLEVPLVPLLFNAGFPECQGPPPSCRVR